METIYPDVGVSGTIVVSEPFNKKVLPHIFYTCIAVESIQAAVKLGKDIFNKIYQAVDLDEDHYKADLKDDVKIITLKTSTEEIVHIPHKYIISMPDSNGVKYNLFAITIIPQVLPLSTDMSLVKEELGNVCTKILGVSSQVEHCVYGSTVMISHEKDEIITNYRENKINLENTIIAKLNAYERENLDLKTKVELLEKFISANFKK